jgi:tetratricopeptide (TPR) repeat protein
MTWRSGVALAAHAVLYPVGIAIALLLLPHARAAAECIPAVARIESVQGRVELRRARMATWQEAQAKGALCPGDTVRVGARARLALLLADETTLRLDQNTSLTVSETETGKASLLDLLLGTLHVITRSSKPFKVWTPFVNAGVEGTEFLVAVGQDEARVAVFEGQVSAANDLGSLMLVGGEMAVAARNLAPRKERLIRPTDAVQWALYYPSIIDYRLDERLSGAAAEAALRESIGLYRQYRVAEAISRLDNIAESARDPRFLTYRAGLLLLVGRADEAKSDIERTLIQDPGNSNAHALQSIVAVAQNDKAQALKLATQAVELDQASPVARIALSYAQQAHFKIEDALASVQKAVELDPQNALAWARLAELHMSTGYLDRALEAAQRAVSLNPDVAKTQSVLGFAHLTRIDTQAARQAFQKAIELDQADPLPRLGLGLAKIREGDLTAGREEIEIAVSLDPENSLLRSYVGKAYYEERRDSLAGIQFELAKERDPRDPTPWFYDAIRKQAGNRPVEALQDVQKSIELNDNRAVYRSRLLLDEDLAARSASQARVFRQLGFEHLALATAFEAVDLDPGNHAAHRLLSDLYLAKPRHEIARVSELLRAQLLQPENLSPLQPQVAESDLVLLEQGSVSTVSIGEYSSLLVRDRVAALGGVVAGSRNTFSDDVIVTGVRGPLSLSAGQNHLASDGVRRNDDLTQDAYGFLMHARPGPSVGLQAEFRQTDSVQGDRRSNFDPNLFSETRREERESEFSRLGLSFKPTAETQILGSMSHRDFRFRRTEALNTNVPGLGQMEIVTRQEGVLGELQHLWRGRAANVTAGAGTYRASDEARSFQRLPAIVRAGPATTAPIQHDNAYAYSIIYPFRRLQLTLGLSADAFRQERVRIERNQVNPKFGLLWRASGNTTIRFAAFRVLKRALTANQTVEPTHVAGFNQFFDDINGTQSRRYGLGIDQRFLGSLYGGVQLAKRDLRVPAIDAQQNQSWKERAGEAYLYWHPGTILALRAALDYLELDRGADLRFNSFRRIRTIKAPLGASLSLPGQVTLRVGATYVRQSGDFPQLSAPSISDSDRFWLIDASLDFLLPRRYGYVGIAATNLLDRSFRLQQDIDPTKPTFREFEPLRRVFIRLSLLL